MNGDTLIIENSKLTLPVLIHSINEPDNMKNMSEDPLTMDYFDNLDNGPLNKYKINLKNKKKL
jgi:hypothetical protein